MAPKVPRSSRGSCTTWKPVPGPWPEGDARSEAPPLRWIDRPRPDSSPQPSRAPAYPAVGPWLRAAKPPRPRASARLSSSVKASALAVDGGRTHRRGRQALGLRLSLRPGALDRAALGAFHRALVGEAARQGESPASTILGAEVAHAAHLERHATGSEATRSTGDFRGATASYERDERKVSLKFEFKLTPGASIGGGAGALCPHAALTAGEPVPPRAEARGRRGPPRPRRPRERPRRVG